MSKVLIINGSPKPQGNTARALAEVAKTLQEQGIETETIHVGNKDIRGCIGCGRCAELGQCVFDDLVNQTAQKFAQADGLLIGSPVYYASPAGTLISFLDRLFYSSRFPKTMKVGAAVVVARRGGCTATFDVLTKYFGISNMPIATSQYWNQAHGRLPGEAADDAEGMQTMRQLGLNMAFLIKSIALGREQFGLPLLEEEHAMTNFMR
jgi:multimeric flavodoxin WrbA